MRGLPVSANVYCANAPNIIDFLLPFPARGIMVAYEFKNVMIVCLQKLKNILI
jgi:hypothetical protein